MAVRISQFDDRASEKTTLTVEGSLTLNDAHLLECICADLRRQSCPNIIINLEGTTYLNEQSAEVLRQLKLQPGICLTGCQLYIEHLIECPDSL
jgi:anti-anti-sigma regulatory factor